MSCDASFSWESLTRVEHEIVERGCDPCTRRIGNRSARPAHGLVEVAVRAVRRHCRTTALFFL